MRTVLKIIGSLLLLLAALLSGAALGYRAARDTSYEKLFLGEIHTSLRNTISTGTALRRANTSTYVSELEALILLDVSELNKFTPPTGPQMPAFQLAKGYYTAFGLPVP